MRGLARLNNYLNSAGNIGRAEQQALPNKMHKSNMYAGLLSLV